MKKPNMFDGTNGPRRHGFRPLWIGLLLFPLLALSACGGGSGGGSSGATGSNWDQMNWDQGKWG